jgi:DnaK suppressor protein
MNLETQSHLTHLRQALTWRIHELQAGLDTLATRRDEDAVGSGVTDRKDEADAWQRTDIDAQSERLELGELRRCQEALHRLDSGLYGDCRDCLEPIALQRLMVQPEAERCAACQSKLEARRRHEVQA